MRIIDFKETQCTHCYKCVRYCDVKAVMIKDGKAEIIEDKCILCGHCLHVCPQSAKTMISDLDTVKYYIRTGVKTVVSLVPAYQGFFRETTLGQLHTALCRLGFAAVRETAEGAAAVTAEYSRGMGLVPYYLYRQKNMAGNFENVGYAAPGKECIYNILIMEEKQTIVACGAGTTTKVTFPKENRLERVENVKDVALYIERIDEMIERKEKMLEKLDGVY